MVVRISDKTQNYSKVTKLLVKPKTIPVAELFKHLKKTDLDNVGGLAGEKIMDDEDDERRWEKIWSALIRYRHPIIKECIEKIQVLYDVKISGWDK